MPGRPRTQLEKRVADLEAEIVSLATAMGPGFCHGLGTTWLRGEHGRGVVGCQRGRVDLAGRRPPVGSARVG